MTKIALLAALTLTLITACSRRTLENSAALDLPAEVKLQNGQLEALPIVSFEWNETDPLLLPVHLATRADRQTEASIIGVLRVYDAEGRNMEFMGLDRRPRLDALAAHDPVLTVQRRQRIRLSFYGDNLIDVKEPGRYYAVAVFYAHTARGDNVMFTSDKAWFCVVEGSSISTPLH